MKTIKIVVLFAIFAAFIRSQETSGAVQGSGGTSFTYFYERLKPYGEWIELNDGLVVWKPVVYSREWRPYFRGGWIWTNCGWYWESNEIGFGDIVYHYGRWYNDEYYGWIWVPDYEWAPAWVDWRCDDDYIGWAPLPPYACFDGSHGIVFSVKFIINFSHYNFVAYRDFHRHDLAFYSLPERHKYRVYHHTNNITRYRSVNNSVFNGGPERERFRAGGNETVREREIVFSGSKNIDQRSTVVTGDRRIEVSTPDFRGQLSDRETTNIRKSDRASSLQTDGIRIGGRIPQPARDEKAGIIPDGRPLKNNEANQGSLPSASGGVDDREKSVTKTGSSSDERTAAVEKTVRSEDSRKGAGNVAVPSKEQKIDRSGFQFGTSRKATEDSRVSDARSRAARERISSTEATGRQRQATVSESRSNRQNEDRKESGGTRSAERSNGREARNR